MDENFELFHISVGIYEEMLTNQAQDSSSLCGKIAEDERSFENIHS